MRLFGRPGSHKFRGLHIPSTFCNFHVCKCGTVLAVTLPLYLRRCTSLCRIRPGVPSSTFPRTWRRSRVGRGGLRSVPWCPASTRRGTSSDRVARRRARASFPASIARRTRCRSATCRRRSSRTRPATRRRTRRCCSVPCTRRARERGPGPIHRCTNRRRRSRNGRRSSRPLRPSEERWWPHSSPWQRRHRRRRRDPGDDRPTGHQSGNCTEMQTRRGSDGTTWTRWCPTTLCQVGRRSRSTCCRLLPTKAKLSSSARLPMYAQQSAVRPLSSRNSRLPPTTTRQLLCRDLQSAANWPYERIGLVENRWNRRYEHTRERVSALGSRNSLTSARVPKWLRNN